MKIWKFGGYATATVLAILLTQNYVAGAIETPQQVAVSVASDTSQKSPQTPKGYLPNVGGDSYQHQAPDQPSNAYLGAAAASRSDSLQFVEASNHSFRMIYVPDPSGVADQPIPAGVSFIPTVWSGKFSVSNAGCLQLEADLPDGRGFNPGVTRHLTSLVKFEVKPVVLEDNSGFSLGGRIFKLDTLEDTSLLHLVSFGDPAVIRQMESLSDNPEAGACGANYDGMVAIRVRAVVDAGYSHSEAYGGQQLSDCDQFGLADHYVDEIATGNPGEPNIIIFNATPPQCVIDQFALPLSTRFVVEESALPALTLREENAIFRAGWTLTDWAVDYPWVRVVGVDPWNHKFTLDYDPQTGPEGEARLQALHELIRNHGMTVSLPGDADYMSGFNGMEALAARILGH